MIKAIIDGNIGAGKSFFVTQLSQRYNLTPLLENFEDNFALKKMFDTSLSECCNGVGEYCSICGEGLNVISKKRRYAFITQVIFLITRMEQFLLEYKSNRNCIIERSIFSDKYIFLEELFEQKSINEKEYQMYNRLFTLFLSILDNSNIDIYNVPLILITSPMELTIKRIKHRGRDFERWYTETEEGIKYLQGLQTKYLNMYNNYKGKKLLINNLEDNLDKNLELIQDFLSDKKYKELEYLKEYDVTNLEIAEIYDIIKKRGIDSDNLPKIIDIIEDIRNER